MNDSSLPPTASPTLVSSSHRIKSGAGKNARPVIRQGKKRGAPSGKSLTHRPPHGDSQSNLSPQSSPSSSQSRGIATRRAALRLVEAVLHRNQSAKHAQLATCRDLEPRDRAFVVAMVTELFRWMRPIDALIDSATAQKLDSTLKLRMVLRLALVQLLCLDTPPHAVVSTSLPLLSRGPRRLVHALLSRAQKEKWNLPALPSLPEAVAERWTELWGEAVVSAAEATWAVAPPIDLIFCDAAAAQSFAQTFPKSESLRWGHCRLARSGAIEHLPGYSDGAWWVQDLAAALPAGLLGAGEGRQILDLCAAPGGKTMQLAAAGWQVTSVDKHPHRLRQLRDNLTRTGLAGDVIAADIISWSPEHSYDAVLLDAPCTATGIFRRHPDVLHRIAPHDIEAMAALQSTMLARVQGWVKPGGLLVYSTCSLEKSEGEAQIEHFFECHVGWEIMPITAVELPANIPANADGCLRLLPTMLTDVGGIDSFFIARLRRFN